MKKEILIAAWTLIICCNLKVEGHVFEARDSLHKITSYPIKIDGYNNHYVLIIDSLKQKNAVMIVGQHHRAFIQDKDNWVLFERTKRINKKGGFIDYFKTKGGTMILKIDKIEKDPASKNFNLQYGMLTVNYKTIKQHVKIHGHTNFELVDFK